MLGRVCLAEGCQFGSPHELVSDTLDFGRNLLNIHANRVVTDDDGSESSRVTDRKVSIAILK